LTLLRVSGEANELTIDLEAVLDREHVGDVGIPASAELLAFTNAVELGGDIDAARAALADAIGDEATLQAAATIAIFNGLVRVADGTGIRLDEGVFTASVDEREALGINRFAGAASSADVRARATESEPSGPVVVADLFG
jgi:hypothetical protein